MEELWHALVHGIGILLSIAGLVILVAFSAVTHNIWALVSCAIFGASLILMYSMSTIYHSVSNLTVKKYLKKCDHIAIYYLIAGTYTPFLLTLLRGPLGWTLFGIIWGLALLGTFLKIVLPSNGKKVWSVGLYLGMGWLVLVASDKLFSVISKTGLIFLVLGGLFYTLGIAFYIWKSKKYTHAIWHFFVLLGSVMHFFAVLYGCVL
ncbi:MAG: hemolysin III family protein [Alphaproteobacteria bacterium]|nr:hemolysin III family protein [Alphaproteobacteria bacterium]